MSQRDISTGFALNERPKRFAIPDPDPVTRARAERMLAEFREETAALIDSRRRERAGGFVNPAIFEMAPDELPTGRRIQELEPPELMAVIRASVDLCFPAHPDREESLYCFELRPVGQVASKILRRKLHYSITDVEWLLARIAFPKASWGVLEWAPVSIQGLLRSIERWARKNELTEDARSSLARFREGIVSAYFSSEGRKAVDLIEEMLGDKEATTIDPDDDWGCFAGVALGLLEAEQREAWTRFLIHAASISGTRPSGTWLRATAKHIQSIGASEFERLAIDFLALLDRPTRDIYNRGPDGFSYPSALVAGQNADVLKGIAWSASSLESARLARAIGDAALACFTKIPDFGSRSTKAGNACVHALAEMQPIEALIQLRRLEDRLTLPSARKEIEKALTVAAERRGVSRQELADIGIPTYGLVDGVACTTIGSFVAELSVSGSGSVELRWHRPGGKVQASVPSTVRRDCPDALKELHKQRAALREALSGQRGRIEHLLVEDRSWSLVVWNERYIDHPLTAVVARRLIWTFETCSGATAGIWRDGEIVDVDDQVLDLVDGAITVRLWNPIASTVDEITAWRNWLARHRVTQPFKQAHREIYILTGAERETRVYSNRFAAHILRQHQFSALCQQRGWRYQLQGAWDSHNVPYRDLPVCGLRAEFWVEGIEEAGAAALSHTGVHLYLTTGQIRFLQLDSSFPVDLADVPPAVFSEVMRDIDLFVGVAGIGADPNWLDGGGHRPEGTREYWWEASFGELSAMANTRRDALAGILPRLAQLDGRWELTDRFLNIRGDLRGYRIHLGSGNVLMEPGGQYLCIVPGRGAGGSKPGDGLFLPFEGDQMLSVILSKALMLADDTAIADSSIRHQIVS